LVEKKRSNLSKKVSVSILSIIILSAVIFYAGYTYGISYGSGLPSSIIQSGSMVDGYSYVIFTDGVTYWAKNGATGAIDYESSNATYLIQSVFNNYPQKVLFKAGVFDLNGGTVTANVPIVIEGEGIKSVILQGTLKIQGVDCNGVTWIYNQNIVRNLKFNSTGDIINVWYVNVTQGIIEQNVFWKTSFALQAPQVRLTDSLSIYVQDNWFDGYNCQILKIDGTHAWLPFHYILRNAFGSTLLGVFPDATGEPWKVAAIYIEAANNVYTLIQNNVGFLNPKEIFVFSQSSATMIYDNEIECGEGNYAIWLKSDSNKVKNNIITLSPSSLGAICIYYNATTPLYYNEIIGNNIFSSDADYGIFMGASYYSQVSGNTIFGKNGIYLYSCGYCQVIDNIYRKIGDTSDFALQEAGASAYNVIIGMYARTGYIYIIDPAVTKVNLSWNGTTWIS